MPGDGTANATALRFMCNEMLIPALLEWCDGYKAHRAARAVGQQSSSVEETKPEVCGGLALPLDNKQADACNFE